LILVSRFPPFQSRPLGSGDASEVLQLVRAQGAHGVYVGNAIAAHEGEVQALWGRDRLLGCLWFGPRGNLILLEQEPLDPELVADAVHLSRWPWRIALGPKAPLAVLAQRTVARPLVLRDQVYHACNSAEVARSLVDPQARRAQRADRDRLMAATLELNRVDLNVDPRRVDRRWLRDMVDSRIGDGTTLVHGEPGEVVCKLDLGSRGPFGTMIEGVFTFADQRGRGFATGLVATAAAEANGFVCLHVAADNEPARRSYERAGLREVARCRLLLLA
jgi:predicted GNAT family acetyltransferase